jgi:hypothetical protein
MNTVLNNLEVNSHALSKVPILPNLLLQAQTIAIPPKALSFYIELINGIL